MGVMPDMSAKLPTNLPLENIADYKYAVEADATTSIAPSMFQNKALPDLPPVASFSDGPVAQEPTDQNFQVGPVDGPPPPPPPAPTVDFTKVDDAPPPPPPPVSGYEDGDDDDSMPPPPPPPVVADQDDAPPPPPPPQHEEDPESSAPAEEAPPTMSLLDQIRNPNIKLRKVRIVPNINYHKRSCATHLTRFTLVVHRLVQARQSPIQSIGPRYANIQGAFLLADIGVSLLTLIIAGASQQAAYHCRGNEAANAPSSSSYQRKARSAGAEARA